MSATVMHFCHPVPDLRSILQLHHRRSFLAANFHSRSVCPVVIIIDFSDYDFMCLVERVVYESSIYHISVPQPRGPKEKPQPRSGGNSSERSDGCLPWSFHVPLEA